MDTTQQDVQRVMMGYDLEYFTAGQALDKLAQQLYERYLGWDKQQMIAHSIARIAKELDDGRQAYEQR